MPTKKKGVAYVPVLLSFLYESDMETDAQMAAKDVVIALMEDWQDESFIVEGAEFEFYSLDWLRGSYLDQVQEVEVEDDEPTQVAEGEGSEDR
jgi:hypothetical protein